MLLEEDQQHTLRGSRGHVQLDSPEADKVLNSGTAAPNCQPQHTREATESPPPEELVNQGQEVIMRENASPLLRPSRSSADESLGGSTSAPVSRQNSSSESRPKTRRSHSGLEQDRQKKPSYFQMARVGYQELVNAIIRPPRAEYKEEAMGPPAFTFCGRRFTRTDFTLLTKRGLSLQCSHWEPVERTSDRIPVVIYMHGNSSARVEVIPQLSYLLSLGLAVFSFDFAGSGKSDGQYVSLGYYEREDLMCVIAHLRATNVVSTIALWGRSMGAATALMHGDRDPSIACMILDSPFADLPQLAEEMVEKGREQGINVPNFVVSVALRMIQSSVKKQANFNIRHISPIAHADKCFIPALFVAGEHDDFINKRHSEAIHARYAGDKNLIIVEGDHNSPRPKFMFDSVSIFLQTCLQIPNSWALRIHPGMNLMAPPWYYPGTSRRDSGVRGVTSPNRSDNRRSDVSSSRRSSRASNNSNNDNNDDDEVNAEDMGMTLERQREIQASLFKMLGQADEPEPPSPPRNNGQENMNENSLLQNSSHEDDGDSSDDDGWGERSH